MKKIELTLFFSSLILILLDFLNLLHPKYDFILILILFSLSLFYLFLGFAIFNNLQFRRIFAKSSYSHISNKRILGAIFTGIVYYMSITGIFSKFLLWPGAIILPLLGVIGILIITIIAFFKMNNSDIFYSKILIRNNILGLICVCLLFIPLDTWLNLRYSDYPDFINAVHESEANPNNKTLQHKKWDEMEKMYEL